MSDRIKLSANFHKDEFSCPCCGAFNIDPNLILALQAVRDELGLALTVSSGTRCFKHNEEVGGSKLSDHLLGKAVDIACHQGHIRRRIVSAALKQFPTIGIKKDCIHLSIGMPARIFTYD